MVVVRFEGLESIAVIAAESVGCSDPNETVAVLGDRKDFVRSQSLLTGNGRQVDAVILGAFQSEGQESKNKREVSEKISFHGFSFGCKSKIAILRAWTKHLKEFHTY